jgi:pilus assembly protein CpaE
MNGQSRVRVTVVGGSDRTIESLLTAGGIVATSLPVSDLMRLAQPTVDGGHVIVVDVRETNQFPPSLAQLKRQHPQVAIVLVASTLDPTLMLDAMRAGVSECVAEPLAEADLRAAVLRVSQQSAAAGPTGRVFAMLGAKGGVGTTTLAVNLATELEKEAPGCTLLVDLHLGGGDAAVMLGAEPRFTVFDALQNIHRLDATILHSLVTPTRAGVHLLASADRSLADALPVEGVTTILALAARLYRYVVVDVPETGVASLDALGDTTRVVVVANQELSTIRRASRLVASLQERYGKDRVSVVINRFDQKADIGIKDVEQVVKCRIRHSVPSDYRLALRAQNVGRPLALDNHNRLAAAFRDLARDMAGVRATAKAGATTSLFGRLSGRHS